MPGDLIIFDSYISVSLKKIKNVDYKYQNKNASP